MPNYYFQGLDWNRRDSQPKLVCAALTRRTGSWMCHLWMRASLWEPWLGSKCYQDQQTGHVCWTNVAHAQLPYSGWKKMKMQPMEISSMNTSTLKMILAAQSLTDHWLDFPAIQLNKCGLMSCDHSEMLVSFFQFSPFLESFSTSSHQLIPVPWSLTVCQQMVILIYSQAIERT